MRQAPWIALLCGVLVLPACLRYDDDPPASPESGEAGISEAASQVGSSAAGSDAFDDLEVGDDATGPEVDDRTLAERYADALEGFGFGAEDCGALEPLDMTVRYPLCDFDVTHRRGTRDILPSCGAAEGPAAAPRHVHIAFGSHRADRDVSFNWMSGIENRQAIVEIGTDPDNLDMRFHGYTFHYAGITREGQQHRVVNEVYVCGLEPATTYYYRAGADGAWSDVYSFTTALPVGDETEFRFAVTGDTRHDTNEPWNQALGMIHEFAPDFHLFSGDAVDQGPSQPQWDSWFAAGEPYLAEQFFMPANGNHELMALNYTAQFAMPGDEENYYFRYGNGLFILVNDLSFTDLTSVTGTVRRFLEETLEAHQDATWKVVVHHRPIYSASTRHGSARDLQDAWIPIYDRYGVDLVFNGHDHNYERSRPMRNNQVVAPGDGTTYVVAAGIGAPLYDNGQEFWTAYSERTSNFVIVDVRQNELELTAYRLDGTVLDRTTLRK